MPVIDRLFVIWGEPSSGRRHVIGELGRRGAEYYFGYALDLLPVAEAHGFKLLPEFPERRPIADPFKATYLFPTFGQRIPSPKRDDYRLAMEKWGVQGSDDQLEILAASGGLLATDRLELAEYRGADDDLRKPLRFRVSAERHFDGASQLQRGDQLLLKLDEKNDLDPCATFILRRSGTPVGYVPKQYSALFARLLQTGADIDVLALWRLSLPPERDRWVVEATRK